MISPGDKIQCKIFTQPAGTFFFTILPAEDVILISEARERKYDPKLEEYTDGIERKLSAKQVREIAEFVITENAMFPTPIIIALEDNTYLVNPKDFSLTFNNNFKKGEIIDGQHRIAGIKLAMETTKDTAILDDLKKMELPILFALDTDTFERALIFATINENQRPVSKSFVFDLFGLYPYQSPQKMAHIIALSLNKNPTSPWYRKIKMLGYCTISKKDSIKEGLPLESLTQGTFVRELMQHIKKSGRLRKFYDHEDDLAIAKILLSVFSSVKRVWNNLWDDDKYIISKSVGFTGVIRALPELHEYASNKDVKYFLRGSTNTYFDDIFRNVDLILKNEKKELTGKYFQAGTGANDLTKAIRKAINNVTSESEE